MKLKAGDMSENPYELYILFKILLHADVLKYLRPVRLY